MSSLNILPIVWAAQSESIGAAALAYAALGLSIIPPQGKRPALTTWTEYQQTAASPETIRAWGSAGLLKNIGIICGNVSGNLVVLDLDGAAGYPAFAATFPTLAATYTVASGGDREACLLLCRQPATERQGDGNTDWQSGTVRGGAAGGRATEYPPDYRAALSS